jgi:dipeptidyl aminopeptidase/acylaminoacyl peptidase
VREAIEMTRLADPAYFGGRPSTGRVAQFSPDGKRFVILLRRGHLEKNTNEFSAYLFHTAEALQSPKPELLVRMVSSSNRDAIQNLKWLNDNETIAFLGEDSGGVSQVWTFNVRTRKLQRRTNQPNPVTNYNITADGAEIVFISATQGETNRDAMQARMNGVVVAGQPLSHLLAGDFSEASVYSNPRKLLLQKNRGMPIPIALTDPIYDWAGTPPSISPDGRYVLVLAFVSQIPASWADYKPTWIQGLFVQSKRLHAVTRLRRYFLVDTKQLTLEPLLNAPVVGYDPPQWTDDSQSVSVKDVFLPLDVADATERREREAKTYDIVVRVSDRHIRKLEPEEVAKLGTNVPLNVTLEEDSNTPPKIYVADTKTERKALLLDLNPDFKNLALGQVEKISWNATNGVQASGGLYLPPDYMPGKRYPLVIQTHGFDETRFSMDGLDEWSSAYAARPLAARGFVVLQSFSWGENDDDIESLKHGGKTSAEAFKLAAMSAFEGAIDYLSARGLVDRSRVGIVGFSRTACFVAYTLTHSTYHFGAASLVDGIDCGYFQYILYFAGAPDLEALDGGSSPYGKGLEEWLHNSPSFSLDRVQAPVRLLALGAPDEGSGVLEEWEWFAGLTRLERPVDFIYLPDAAHMIVKPWERRVAEEGLVDWFCFWLKHEEDADPQKADQYARWRDLEQKLKSPKAIE